METMTGRDPGDETAEVSAIERVIARLEAMPKQGESYDHKGRHGWANPVRADTGKILEALVVARQAKRILEIGTAHGLSGCYLARRLDGEGLMVSIEWDENRAQDARANFEEAGLPVQVLNGDAMKLIPDLEGQFDLVFMDANKDGYLEQIKLFLELGLLNPNGATIVADNVIDRQKECQNFLDFMEQYNPVLIPTECGLLVATV